jgi:Arc/MetJ-type ribon-helix-helix transcriptional regulator
MTIEIQRPELEALIRERMKSGAFQNVEDVVMQALKASPAPDQKDAGRSDEKSSAMGAELVEAMQASPFKEIGIEPGRERMPVRDAGF